MSLVMKQADTIYEKKMLEMSRRDEERTKEAGVLYSYPNPQNNSELKVHFKNRGSVPIKIVRVWINDDYLTQDVVIAAMNQTNLGPFPVDLVNDSYYKVQATTERGTVFTSLSGSLHWLDGVWYTPELLVTVTIINQQGQYNIKVYNVTMDLIDEWDSGGVIHDDIVQSFEVADPGTYTVYMKRKVSGNWKNLDGSPITVEITWPDGAPIVYVYGDGEEYE
jgi:hypothetical protein